MKRPWRSLRLPENLKESCIRFFHVLLYFVFSKTRSNFLPILSDEASLKSLEMHQLKPEEYVYNISTERPNSSKMCLYEGSPPMLQKKFYSDHTHLFIYAHKHCSQVLEWQNSSSSYGIPLLPFHNKYLKYRWRCIYYTCSHSHWFKRSFSKGHLRKRFRDSDKSPDLMHSHIPHVTVAVLYLWQ